MDPSMSKPGAGDAPQLAHTDLLPTLGREEKAPSITTAGTAIENCNQNSNQVQDSSDSNEKGEFDRENDTGLAEKSVKEDHVDEDRNREEEGADGGVTDGREGGTGGEGQVDESKILTGLPLVLAFVGMLMSILLIALGGCPDVQANANCSLTDQLSESRSNHHKSSSHDHSISVSYPLPFPPPSRPI